MIKNIFTYLIAIFTISILFIACSENNDGKIAPIISEDGIPVAISTRAQLPDDMECTLYIYGKSSQSGDYNFERTISFANEDTKQITFKQVPASGYWYRFLFVSSKPIDTEIALSGVNTGSSWQDIRFTASKPNLTGDYYYAVRDYTYQDLVDAGSVNVQLIRLVGQVAVDFWRDGGKKNALIASALDRVSNINVKYTGLSKVISFDANGQPVTEELWTPSNQIIIPALGDTLQVEIPQEDLGLILSPAVVVDGNVRILGWKSLPADQLRLEYTFQYYDTTPVNNNDVGFVSRELVLNIPKLSASGNEIPRLKPDTLTVHKATMPLDRIIDVAASGTTDFNIIWENGI